MIGRFTTAIAWHVTRTDDGFKPFITITDEEGEHTFGFKPLPTYAEARRAAKQYARPLRAIA